MQSRLYSSSGRLASCRGTKPSRCAVLPCYDSFGCFVQSACCWQYLCLAGRPTAPRGCSTCTPQPPDLASHQPSFVSTSLLQYAQMRVEYVPAYAAYLRSRDMRAAEELRPPKVPQAVQDMDLALPEKTILMFRCVGAETRSTLVAEVSGSSKAEEYRIVSWLPDHVSGLSALASRRQRQTETSASAKPCVLHEPPLSV
jgi:hypothetical protein